MYLCYVSKLFPHRYTCTTRHCLTYLWFTERKIQWKHFLQRDPKMSTVFTLKIIPDWYHDNIGHCRRNLLIWGDKSMYIVVWCYQGCRHIANVAKHSLVTSRLRIPIFLAQCQKISRDVHLAIWFSSTDAFCQQIYVFCDVESRKCSTGIETVKWRSIDRSMNLTGRMVCVSLSF